MWAGRRIVAAFHAASRKRRRGNLAVKREGLLEGKADCILVMGVCGAGKSRLGERLAEHLSLPFIEADDFHSDKNRALIAQGRALSDAQRFPWLDTVADNVAATRSASGRPVVLACSALRRNYRDRLRTRIGRIYTLHLDGPRQLLEVRLTERKNHFAGPALLGSQLAVLEPLQADEDGLTIQISAPLDTIFSIALEKLAAPLPQANTDSGQAASARSHRSH